MDISSTKAVGDISLSLMKPLGVVHGTKNSDTYDMEAVENFRSEKD